MKIKLKKLRVHISTALGMINPRIIYTQTWMCWYDIKNNLQTKLSNPEILYQGMDQNSEFIDFTIARTTRDPLITRTPTGGYYRCHYDHWKLGDFSTTIFLNDSDTYAGGELCLWIDNKEERFKLDAGWGITYETGTCHMVSEVVDW